MSIRRVVIGIVTIIVAGTIGALIFAVANTASCSRYAKTWDSKMNNGLNRKVSVYSYTGEKICGWQGKLDYIYGDNRLLFDMDGKRYSVLGGIVVTEEQ